MCCNKLPSLILYHGRIQRIELGIIKPTDWVSSLVIAHKKSPYVSASILETSTKQSVEITTKCRQQMKFSLAWLLQNILPN